MNWLVKNPFLRLLALGYGLFVFLSFSLFALLDGSYFRRPSEQDRKLLREAQQKYWDLAEKPFGLTHRFFKLHDGRRLHYVEKVPSGSPETKTLTIFIHGFPDSWPVWRRQLASPRLSKNSILVAVDLPGYGGSESFAKMDADAVLEAITEFVLGMREKHLDEDGRVVIVTHDWGSIIGYRLAAEAPQLADHFIITSIVHPSLTLANIKSRILSAIRMLKTFYHDPRRNFRILKTALTTMAPLGAQLSRSGYIFAFNLPAPLVAIIGTLGDAWFLRMAHKLALVGSEITPSLFAEAMSISHGPGLDQCQPKKSAPELYPESVVSRVSDNGWESKMRIYRHGLALGKWNKSLDSLVALNALDPDSRPATKSRRRSSSAGPATQALFDAPPGALQAPTTIVYGWRDPAFDGRIALDGIKEYLVKGSQVVILKTAGHWVPVESEASKVLEEIVDGYIKGDDDGVQNVRNLAGEGVRISVDV